MKTSRYSKPWLIAGVGIDDADYPVKSGMLDEAGFVCPVYLTWYNMLTRCYSEKPRPAYVGCTVCEEWHRFSNFAKWMRSQDWEGKQLDKDLLVAGNKVYSPKTCVFIPRLVNTFISRGKATKGYTFSKRQEKFIAKISNPFTGKQESIGLFNSAAEAHAGWLEKKYEFAKLLAAEQDDARVTQALLALYNPQEVLCDASVATP